MLRGDKKQNRHVGKKAFINQKTLLRVTGDIIALSPPLIIEKNQIDQLIENLKTTLQQTE